MSARMLIGAVWGLILAMLIGTQGACRRDRSAGKPPASVLEFRILAERDAADGERLRSSNPDYQKPVQEYLDLLKTEGPTTRPSGPYRWFKISGASSDDFISDPSCVIAEYGGAKYVLAHDTPDMGLLESTPGWSIRAVAHGRDTMGRPAVDFTLAGNGPKLFGELTGSNIRRELAILVDNEVLAAPTIQSAIFDRGQITGRFSVQYVSDLAARLSSEK